jgi:hypothetical protein
MGLGKDKLTPLITKPEKTDVTLVRTSDKRDAVIIGSLDSLKELTQENESGK